MQEWLSFVGSEIHKGFLFPTFWYKDDAPKAARQRIEESVAYAAEHLRTREHLVGDRFTVADAHLTWALLLLRYARVEIDRHPSLVSYLERMQTRPAVREAIAMEMVLRKTVAV